MRPKHSIKYHKNNTARPASKHPNHTTPPSYYNTHKTSLSLVVARHLANHPSKHALQYTIKITRACVQNTKSNITKITPLAPHQNIPTIPQRHLTITLTKPHIPTSSHDFSRTTPQNMHFNTLSKSRAHASKTPNQISQK